jgi:hypothetical protein
LADAACEGVTDPHDAGLRVETLAAHAEPRIDRAAATALVHTFMYVTSVAAVEEQPNARLQPVDGPSLFPVALRVAGEDFHRLWRELADEVQHPVARARCWDIVFTLRLMRNRRDAGERAVLRLMRNRRDAGGRAVRAYLDAAATTTLSRQHKANGVLRAWTIARLVGFGDLADEITSAMMAAAEEAVVH